MPHAYPLKIIAPCSCLQLGTQNQRCPESWVTTETLGPDREKNVKHLIGKGEENAPNDQSSGLGVRTAGGLASALPLSYYMTLGKSLSLSCNTEAREGLESGFITICKACCKPLMGQSRAERHSEISISSDKQNACGNPAPLPWCALHAPRALPGAGAPTQPHPEAVPAE